jgi:hypothetical protein
LKNIQDIYPKLLHKTKIIRDQNFVNLGNSAEVAFSSIIDNYKKAPTRGYVNKLYVGHKLFIKKYIWLCAYGEKNKKRSYLKLPKQIISKTFSSFVSIALTSSHFLSYDP